MGSHYKPGLFGENKWWRNPATLCEAHIISHHSPQAWEECTRPSLWEGEAFTVLSSQRRSVSQTSSGEEKLEGCVPHPRAGAYIKAWPEGGRVHQDLVGGIGVRRRPDLRRRSMTRPFRRRRSMTKTFLKAVGMHRVPQGDYWGLSTARVCVSIFQPSW